MHGKKARKSPTGKLLKFLFRPSVWTAVYLILAPVAALVELGLAYAMSSAVDYALNGSLEDAGFYGLAYGCYILLSMICGYFCKRVRQQVLADTMVELKQKVYTSVMSLTLGQFQQKNSGGYLADLTTNMELVRDSLFQVMLTLYPEVLQFLVATVAMFWLSPWMGGYVILLAVAQMVIPAIFSKPIEERGRRFTQGQEHYTVTVKENLQSFQTAKLFHMEDYLAKRQRSACQQAEQARCASKSMNAFSYEVSFAIGNAIYLGIFLIGALMVIQGKLALAAVVAASQLMVYIASPLTTMSGDLAELKSTAQAAENFVTLLEQKPQSSGTLRPETVTTGLEVKNLCYAYPEHPVLEGLNVRFTLGKKYVILGGSGCGKSTLLKLLAGLDSAYQGQILLDGTSIGSLEPGVYTRLVSCMPQEPFLFDGSIRMNVALGRAATDEQIIRALDDAGLGDYLRRQPEGLDTQVGENAGQMSGGEKQRLSIARVLLFPAPILLMDESTSHLDPTTAAEIESLIFHRPDTTVIFVTHNLTPQTAEAADQIYELRQGRLVERTEVE
jgi:ATP-binding cassette subfamily B protein